MAALQRILQGGLFSSSNNANASANAAVARSGRIFGDIGTQIQRDERLALQEQEIADQAKRFERTQAWAEGAPGRKLAAAKAERERVRQAHPQAYRPTSPSQQRRSPCRQAPAP